MTYTVEHFITLPNTRLTEIKYFIESNNLKNGTLSSFYLSNNYNLYPNMPSFILITDSNGQINAFLSIYADNEEEAEVTISLDEAHDNKLLLNTLFNETKKIFTEYNYNNVLIKFSSKSLISETITKKLQAILDHSELLMRLSNLTYLTNSDIRNFQFKELTTDDVQSLATLQSTIFHTSFETALTYVNEGLQNPLMTTFIMKDSQLDLLIGCCSITTDKEKIHLFGLAVLRKYRHLGVGTMLLTNVINESIRLGATKISLEVDTENKNAISLYKKLGFEEIEQTNYYRFVLEKE